MSTTVRSDDVNISLQPSKRPGKSDDNTVSEDDENIDETCMAMFDLITSLLNTV